MELLSWIDIARLDWSALSTNPNAMDLLKKNRDKIDWNTIARNPNPEACALIHAFMQDRQTWLRAQLATFEGRLCYALSRDPYESIENSIRWDLLLDRPEAIPLLEAFPEKIHWSPPTKVVKSFFGKPRLQVWTSHTIQKLHLNEKAIPLLEKNLSKINWYALSENKKALPLIEREISQAIKEKLNWCYLSRIPEAIPLLEKYPEHIYWKGLSANPCKRAVQILEAFPDKIDWQSLSFNPHALHLLRRHPKKISWMGDLVVTSKGIISDILNPKVISLMLTLAEEFPETLDTINWSSMSSKPEAMPLLEKYPDRIHWSHLCYNTAAISLLEQNPDKIDWYSLSSNKNAASLFEKYLDKIVWCDLTWINVQYNRELAPLYERFPYKVHDFNWSLISSYPLAVPFLEKHKDKINWYAFSTNPAIFVAAS